MKAFVQLGHETSYTKASFDQYRIENMIKNVTLRLSSFGLSFKLKKRQT